MAAPGSGADQAAGLERCIDAMQAAITEATAILTELLLRPATSTDPERMRHAVRAMSALVGLSFSLSAAQVHAEALRSPAALRPLDLDLLALLTLPHANGTRP